MVPLGCCQPGSVGFNDAFGYGEANILFLLEEFGVFVGLHLEDEGVGRIQGVNGAFQISALPELIGCLAMLQG